VIKIKPLSPSLREKKRYLVYEITSKEKITKNQATTMLKSAIKRYIGELGLAKAGIIYLDYKNNKGILRMNNKEVNNVKAALSLIDNMIFKTIYTTGLLNKARKKLEVEKCKQCNIK